MFYRRKINYAYFIYFYYTISVREITIKTLPGICLRQCIALPSADRCPFDRSLFLAQRAVALSAVHSDAAVKQGLRCCSYQGAETKRKRNRFTVPFFWLPKLDSNQRPARVAVPGICLRQCIALPSADRCPFDRSLFLAQRAVALSAVHSDAAVKQGLRCCSYQGAETKRKRNRFTVPFFWLPKLDSNQRPCG